LTESQGVFPCLLFDKFLSKAPDRAKDPKSPKNSHFSHLKNFFIFFEKPLDKSGKTCYNRIMESTKDFPKNKKVGSKK
jgi:hypothetical protein